MHQPTWSHVRADMFLFYYNLRLLGRAATQRRFFTERCISSPDGDYLAIEEYDTDGTADSFDRVDARLIVISTERAEEALVSRQQHGGIRPLRFEAEKLFMTSRISRSTASSSTLNVPSPTLIGTR